MTALLLLLAAVWLLPALAIGVLVVLDRPMPRTWEPDAEWLARMRGEGDG